MPFKLQSESETALPITCILSDVDGVMTDGKIIYDAAGLETKCFHVRDGLGVKLWMQSGFQFGIITSRQSEIVRRRATELGIQHVSQGQEQKWPEAVGMMAALKCKPENVCYVGDDLPDIPVMQRVGLAVAPADAATDTRRAAQWILRSRGGEGALRELIERLLRSKQRWEEHLCH
ncbi:KdsC family phosphatase [Stieleria varia]|uniref:3-deoxy-D-manno-octulosonate 8-phosphate phosphatase KdsC n=1 Tax=Stieleria varia TaxID=2528005 RepID=A0A5C6AS76_9BACT|nr:HAD-IIIA family hydrolase [Stieleria varia]TWU02550.1 3-deoxy-D-manno-octulosonate 8-phosphate phosphatase KdsC [Stieleria varia]